MVFCDGSPSFYFASGRLLDAQLMDLAGRCKANTWKEFIYSKTIVPGLSNCFKIEVLVVKHFSADGNSLAGRATESLNPGWLGSGRPFVVPPGWELQEGHDEHHDPLLPRCLTQPGERQPDLTGRRCSEYQPPVVNSGSMLIFQGIVLVSFCPIPDVF